MNKIDVIKKLIIGSANFGLTYGIHNRRQLSNAQIYSLLRYAASQHIWGIDTARAYGNAEARLGNFIRSNRNSFRIITKLSDADCVNRTTVDSTVHDSLEKLQVKQIDYAFIHSFAIYKKFGKNVILTLEKLKNEKLIGNWGISVYHPKETQCLINDGWSDFAIEFPINIFDRRFLKKNLLNHLKDKKCHLFARSVFLQGLFFMRPQQLNSFFSPAAAKLAMLQKMTSQANLKISEAALLFVYQQSLLDGIIIGVDSVKQLIANMQIYRKQAQYKLLEKQINNLEVTDQRILLPYLWPHESS